MEITGLTMWGCLQNPATPFENISKWIRNEGMSAHKIGKQWLFVRQEIDSWIVGHDGQGGKPRQKKDKETNQ